MRGNTFCLRAALAVLVLLSGSLQGCISWPKQAQGGLAELQPASDPLLTTLRSAFARLLDENAERKHPAKMLQAQLLLVRAHREHAAGLLIDYRETARQTWETMREIDPRLGPFQLQPAVLPREDRSHETAAHG
jgi:hypothetical protein